MTVNEPVDPANGQFPQTRLNKIRVYKDRARYDYETVHSIIDSTFVSHVSFIGSNDEGEPIPLCFPLTAVLGKWDDLRSPDVYEALRDAELESERRDCMRVGAMDLYLHGNAASQLYKSIRASTTGSIHICVESTKVDGVVLFLTPNGHSLNYRSATVHGSATLLHSSQSAKKRWVMRLLTNHMVTNRWENTHPVAASSMTHVQIIEVKVQTASAKVRAKNVGKFDPANVVHEAGPQNWIKKPVWTGVVPLYEMLGNGLGSGVSRFGGSEEARFSVDTWKAERNRREREYAVQAAAKGDPEQEMKDALHDIEVKLNLLAAVPDNGRG